MSMLRIYLYGIGQKVIIPTIVSTTDGVFMEVEPVSVFDVQDLNAWKKYVIRKLESGNVLIQGTDKTGEPGSAVLERLGLRKWHDFETNAVMYTIHKGAMYFTIYSTGRDEKRMWTKSGHERKFASGAPIGMVVDELANDLVKEPEAFPKSPTLLLGG